MPWAFFNPDDTDDDGPKWQKPTEDEERGFFNLTDHCETVSDDDDDNDDNDD